MTVGTSAGGMLRGCRVQATSGCWFLKSESRRLDRGVGDKGACQAQRQKGPCGRDGTAGTGKWARRSGTHALASALGRGIPSWQSGSVESATVHGGCPWQADGEAPSPHISALLVLHPHDGARPGLLLCLVLMAQLSSPPDHTTPEPGPGLCLHLPSRLRAPLQPQPAALQGWPSSHGGLQACRCSHTSRGEKGGPAPSGGH